MSDKSAGDKPIKNSLLSTASTGFSLEDFSDARLLVPVPLTIQEEILKNSAEATAEIDLQSDDVSLEDNKPFIMPEPEPDREEEKPKSIRDSAFISFFSRGSKGDSAEKNQPPPPPSVVKSTSLSQDQEPSFLPSAPPLFVPSTSKPEPVTVASPELFPVFGAAPAVVPLQSEPGVQLIQFDGQQVENRDSQVPVSVEGISQGIQGVTLYTPVTTGTGSGIISTEATPASTFYNSNALNYPETSLPPPVTNETPASENSSGSIPNVGAPPAPVNPANVSSTSAVSTAGQGSSVNKYRLGSQRPQYAQYPGLLPTVPAATTMGNLASQPPVPSIPSNTTQIPPAVGGASTTTHTVSSPLTPSFPQEYAGTGYVFGEPPPMKTVAVPSPMQYTPVSYHWFYYKEVEGKGIWKPFSFLDSVTLEEAYLNGSTNLVATDGGRYDVNVIQRLRTPVYWEETPTEVRRCSWFYKGPLDNRFIPYEEEFAQHIEDEFEAAITTGIWQRRFELGGGEAIIMHSPTVIVHFCQAASPDEWGNLPENQLRPRVVKRGVDKTFVIEDGESAQIDHLVFLVHGIGAICDFKFRSIVEAVDDFRSLSNQMLHTNFSNALEKGIVGRIEFLPVCWHKALHGDCGVDRKLKPITLQSIPKLRHFTNDTLLDILFYTSPFYCQRIVDTVGNEINRMYNLFMQRNLSYDGSVSLGGHSLGSLILFDLLSHQPANILRADAKPEASKDEKGEPEELNANPPEKDEKLEKEGGSSKLVSYTIGHAGTGQPAIKYPAFDFHPTCFFAMGSPTAVFISVRGIDILGQDFKFPTCRNFLNIFHPYDPVAYRMEPLIDPNIDKPAVVIPHHKGRKRFHLEIKDVMFKMGTDIKQTMVETIKNTWKTVYSLASFGKTDESSGTTLEQEIDRVIEGELTKSVETQMGEQPQDDGSITIGQLNGGRRIDYVLQEGPLESFNEYLFALSSHVCYWESEDTMLMIMKEIYQSIGIFPDSNPASTTALPPTAAAFANQSGTNSLSTTTAKPSVSHVLNSNNLSGAPSFPTAGQMPSYSYGSDAPYSVSTGPSAAPNFYNPASFGSTQQMSTGPPMQNLVSTSNPYSPAHNSVGVSSTAYVDPQYQAPVPVYFPSDGQNLPSAPQAQATNNVLPGDNSTYRNPSPVGPPPLSGFVPKS